MDMPGIHVCAQLVSENEQLKRKLRKIKQQNIALQRELNDVKDRMRMEAMLKDFVTTRNMETQTDPPKVSNTMIRCEKSNKKHDTSEEHKVNQLLSMHNGLMKRYEKELKINMQHVETITNLNLKLNEVEQKLREVQMKIHQLEMEHNQVTKSPQHAPADSGVQLQLRQVTRERDRYRDERDRLRLEIRGLDHTFFEEIEDMKFSLQQSTRLNQEYERTLRKVCHQFGVPYPHPELQVSQK